MHTRHQVPYLRLPPQDLHPTLLLDALHRYRARQPPRKPPPHWRLGKRRLRPRRRREPAARHARVRGRHERVALRCNYAAVGSAVDAAGHRADRDDAVEGAVCAWVAAVNQSQSTGRHSAQRRPFTPHLLRRRGSTVDGLPAPRCWGHTESYPTTACSATTSTATATTASGRCCRCCARGGFAVCGGGAFQSQHDAVDRSCSTHMTHANPHNDDAVVRPKTVIGGESSGRVLLPTRSQTEPPIPAPIYHRKTSVLVPHITLAASAGAGYAQSGPPAPRADPYP